eukprot:TRINITY_DN4753_c0_g1_i2.p2 TRINITY_DN4753_c0_g1~~TRINITY_DN4753_c0_g1_i2.p2  ORF type:complete len:270 (+),score=107.87 TRINITY_DN4753_c0_g1_i2:86-811(+)
MGDDSGVRSEALEARRLAADLEEELSAERAPLAARGAATAPRPAEVCVLREGLGRAQLQQAELAARADWRDRERHALAARSRHRLAAEHRTALERGEAAERRAAQAEARAAEAEAELERRSAADAEAAARELAQNDEIEALLEEVVQLGAQLKTEQEKHQGTAQAAAELRAELEQAREALHEERAAWQERQDELSDEMARGLSVAQGKMAELMTQILRLREENARLRQAAELEAEAIGGAG